ncbi:MarR family winged helix-turn-helix transcriptional regulator [Sphingosinicella sp. CPCC 101087]|uniref:MarR family winged helix-turn-helix transcriptional regulator n=1 Tax=Sphingosinicella sp. CPCC 101087 TaxID=2497754 RepID=UPI00101C567D|nr:winged helix DNA-binding protein [Sphingosinicella sp. CPCC 101087]
MTHINRSANIMGALALALCDRMAADRDAALPDAALIHLSHCRSPTIESLRRVLNLSHSATVRLADRLENAGLAMRSRDSIDRRAIWLRLTPQGERLANERLRKRSASLASVMSDALSPAEQRVFSRLAEKMLLSLTGSRDDLYRICRLCNFEVCDDCPVAAAVSPE